jgi:hypothetical protein
MKLVLVLGGVLSALTTNIIRDKIIYNELFEYTHGSFPISKYNSKMIRRIKKRDIPINSTPSSEQNLEIMSPKRKENQSLNLFKNEKSETYLTYATHSRIESNNFVTTGSNKNDKNTLMSDRKLQKLKKKAVEKKVFEKNATRFDSIGNNNEVTFRITPIKKTSINFGIFFALKHTFCLWKTKNEKVKIFKFVRNYLSDRLDVLHYLKTLENVDRLKTILFNQHQNLSFEFLKTPNLYNKDELESLHLDLNTNCDKNFNNLVGYYSQQMKNNEMTDTDEKLLNMINPDIKNLCQAL